MGLRSWEDLRVQFRLAHSDRQTFDLLVSAIPSNLLHKIGIQATRPWWKDWKWYPATPFSNYKPRLGYRWLSPHLPMVDTLNQRWHLHSATSHWSSRFQTIWKAITEPKMALFAWCLLFQGLPVGPRLQHLGIHNPRCPFCGQPESFLHLFWFCRRAQQYWQWIHDFFKPFRPEPFSWHMIVLGDSPRLPSKFTQVWHTFRMEILFNLWKDRNAVIFAHSSIDTNVAMYNKASICNNVIMQIQVQANKVALEVAHLQELLNHWGNAPCTVARVPPDALSAEGTPPRGRRRGRSSSARRSHTPRSQAPRHHSPRGGGDGWRRRSASPPRRTSGWGPSPVQSAPPDAPGSRRGWDWPPATSSKFPRLALAISPPRAEDKEKEKEEENDGWPPPDPTVNPTPKWGSDDKDPPPSAATALAA